MISFPNKGRVADYRYIVLNLRSIEFNIIKEWARIKHKIKGVTTSKNTKLKNGIYKLQIRQLRQDKNLCLIRMNQLK